jgi:cytidylate kinase
MQKKITIAIDGYSSCGKSTLAKALAKELEYIFIDSGAMYRGVTLYCLRNGLLPEGIPAVALIETTLEHIDLDFKFNPETKQADLYLNGENVEELIRLPEVASHVSKIAALKNVRHKLVLEQRKMGKNGGIVMDGRDIGSVVFPTAELKLFITALPEIRAQRRYKELKEKQVETSFEAVLENLRERDYLDSTRTESPLVQTPDAIVIDTSDLTPEEQLTIALNYASEKIQKA